MFDRHRPGRRFVDRRPLVKGPINSAHLRRLQVQARRIQKDLQRQLDEIEFGGPGGDTPPLGTLYIATASDLYRINENTGAWSGHVMSFPFTVANWGVAFDRFGQWFVISQQGSSNFGLAAYDHELNLLWDNDDGPRTDRLYIEGDWAYLGGVGLVRRAKADGALDYDNDESILTSSIQSYQGSGFIWNGSTWQVEKLRRADGGIDTTNTSVSTSGAFSLGVRPDLERVVTLTTSNRQTWVLNATTLVTVDSASFGNDYATFVWALQDAVGVLNLATGFMEFRSWDDLDDVLWSHDIDVHTVTGSTGGAAFVHGGHAYLARGTDVQKIHPENGVVWKTSIGIAAPRGAGLLL